MRRLKVSAEVSFAAFAELISKTEKSPPLFKAVERLF